MMPYLIAGRSEIEGKLISTAVRRWKMSEPTILIRGV